MLPTKRTLVPLFVILMVVLQLMLPALARADEAAPPTEPGTEVAVDPPVETTPTVPEILEQAPEGTEIVVMNTDGSLEPLATQAAADAITTSDPIWCPSTATGPTDLSCTPSQTTVTDLLGYLGANSGTYFGDGTIYFTTDYSTDDVYIDPTDVVIGPLVAALQGLAIVGDTGGGVAANLTVPVFVVNWLYDVQIDNLNIDLTSYSLTSYGLDVETDGNIGVSNVALTGAGYDGAYLDNCYLVDIDPDPDVTDWECSTTNDVTVTGSTFNTNDGAGLYVDSAGMITLTTVSADGNAYGADLNASDTISITGTSTFNGNDFYGLWAGTGSGNVSLTDVDASGNQYGALVGTDAGDVTVTLSTFNDNNTLDPDLDGPGFGLQAGTSLGNVDLVFVTATGNDIGAMVGSAEGDVDIAVSTFNDNTDTGLQAGTLLGTLTLTDVIANNTVLDPIEQAYGAYLVNYDGPIEVWGGEFSGNTAKGLYIESTGLVTLGADLTLTGVQAVDNGVKGAYITYLAPCGTTTGGVDVSVDNGTYMTNGGFGIYAAIGPDGTLTTVTTPTLGDNGGATGLSMYDIVVDNSVFPCPPPEEPKGESKPYHVVEVPETGGEPVEQNCTDYAGTVMILPGEDKATLNCPAAGSLNLLSLLQEALPGSIPQGTEFLSAFQFILMDGDQPVTLLPNGGTLNLAFKLPEDANPNDLYAILYWDPTAQDGAGGWVELPKFMARFDGSPLAFALHPDADPADGMRILSGTRTLGNYVKATVNFTGVFVLIKK